MTYWRLHHHIVWATKQRHPLIDDETRRAVERSIWDTCEELGIVVHAVGSMPDHIHVAVSIPPRLAVAEAVRRMKGASSHAANTRRHGPEAGFAWQAEYGAHSVGDRALPQVIDYVKDQLIHHSNYRLFRALERTGAEV